MTYSVREQIVEVVNRLFYYTDYQMWDELMREVFAEDVHMDMTSLGAPKGETLSAKTICQQWKEGFSALDAIHHQPGNYIVKVDHDIAHVKAYAVATHYKSNAKNGTTRTFVGSYDFRLVNITEGWRLNSFVFNLKYMEGNLELN